MYKTDNFDAVSTKVTMPQLILLVRFSHRKMPISFLELESFCFESSASSFQIAISALAFFMNPSSKLSACPFQTATSADVLTLISRSEARSASFSARQAASSAAAPSCRLPDCATAGGDHDWLLRGALYRLHY